MKKIIKIAILTFCIISTGGYAQKTTSHLRPYDEVITSETITKKGFLSVHLLKNKFYLEIPSAMLNKELLFVRHGRYGNSKQIKWIKKENKIHLIIPEIQSKAGNTIPLIKGKFIEKMTVATFPILAIGDKGLSDVIDITSLFLKTPKELHGGVMVIFDDLAFINKVLAFDAVIEVKTSKTTMSDKGSITADVDYSLVLLPEPMMPRLYDCRMGFHHDKQVPATLDNKVSRASIVRWRLEKKDPDKELSDPIKPITFYFDPVMPDKWKPYVKMGVEEWLPAFEAAGFKNAIVVKEPPVNDENWAINSMRYSYIRWVNHSKYRGHEGEGGTTASKIIDERTGEILKGDVLIGEINFLVDRYFTRCSPLDKRAQEYPFPDDLMGELIQSLTAHEAGHIFGLMDGNYGEYTYPFERMRDKKWLQEMGHTPSAMSYARDNFIVQPEDSIPPSLLIQKVGPTDLYSIRWGYTPFKEAKTPDAELPYLEKIVREQDSIPWYKYIGNTGIDYGPGVLNEIVESDNPVKATALGIQNLKRVIQLIPSATRNEPESEIKRRFYRKTLQLWIDQMESVVSLVGGYTAQYKSAGQEGSVYTPVRANRQREAVAFLNTYAFHPPLWMAPPNLIRRFSSESFENVVINSRLAIISRRQLKILFGLLDTGRLKRVEETSLTMENGYSITDLLQDLYKGLWSELESRDIKINPYRQELQIAYIIRLKAAINSVNSHYPSNFLNLAVNKYSYSNYTRAGMLSALNTLKNTIEKAIQNTNDIVTKEHLELCLLEIKSK
ncbi:zinc-dependent metalloprotease [Flavivirga amylovorans]|uniref:Zinc-dependent metalloprotease n=1 Tax=Flavivirga amylovorans TaxID=870486 RepID=A0ABT8X764_9FLAO|nr:zinc-dependent metalloprotease [Flavivirga amylovorans]MDO5989528.1 zinc-dependent metalloprotease [Flavivirga amylovorans]